MIRLNQIYNWNLSQGYNWTDIIEKHWETSVTIWYRSSLEWVEFSPHEIGMAKYGTFMKTEDFGSKFFCGKKLTPFPEPPLHYMQGKAMAHCIWTIKGMLNMRVTLNRAIIDEGPWALSSLKVGIRDFIEKEREIHSTDLGYSIQIPAKIIKSFDKLPPLRSLVRFYGITTSTIFMFLLSLQRTTSHIAALIRWSQGRPYESCLLIPLSIPSYLHCFFLSIIGNRFGSFDNL